MVLKYHYLLLFLGVSIETGQFETIYSALNLSRVLKDTKIFEEENQSLMKCILETKRDVLLSIWP